MSESVSQALFLTGGKEAFETASKIDGLFDCLNVTSICEGKKEEKGVSKSIPVCK